jgi:hypothetical protein
MAATDHLGQQFPKYHGTNAQLNVGDYVDPSKGDDGHSYFTSDRQTAIEYAGTKDEPDESYPGVYRAPKSVYRVEPTGNFHQDPHHGDPTLFRTAAPMKVTKRERIPQSEIRGY